MLKSLHSDFSVFVFKIEGYGGKYEDTLWNIKF